MLRSQGWVLSSRHSPSRVPHPCRVLCDKGGIPQTDFVPSPKHFKGRNPLAAAWHVVARTLPVRRTPSEICKINPLMAFRFEFDSANQILLSRFEGRFTDESAAEFHTAAWKYAAATDAKAGVVDFASVTEFAVSGETLRRIARLQPSLPNSAARPRVIVAPQTHAFGLFRMFQITGEQTRPLLTVVRTMDEALAALGVESPHFEPLQ